MNYFSRLAGRSGLAASPRAAVTPGAGSPVAATSPGDQPGVGDPFSQPPASDAPAAIAPTSTGTGAAPMPFGPAAAMPEVPRHGPENLARGAPARPRQITHEPTDFGSTDRDASVPAASQHDVPASQPLHTLRTHDNPPAAAGRIVSGDFLPGTAVAPPALHHAAAAPKPALYVPKHVEPPPLVETPSPARRTAAIAERAAALMSSRLRPAPLPDNAEHIAVAAPRDAPAAVPGREDRDAMAPRHDRTAAAARRLEAAQAARSTSVEVHIGAVTLQVHAPAPPAALPTPARSGFAPHRHYLRNW